MMSVGGQHHGLQHGYGHVLLTAIEFLISSTTMSILACGTALPIGNSGDLCLLAR